MSIENTPLSLTHLSLASPPQLSKFLAISSAAQLIIAMENVLLKNLIGEFERYQTTGHKALLQIPDNFLNQPIGDCNNSVAVIVRHVGGNLVSRFTDFLTTDGEKPWRDRDSEFEAKDYTRIEVIALWDKGWYVLNTELAKLNDADLQKLVTIRGTQLSVHAALCRSLAHVAYHVGQIVLAARLATGENWHWITIPRGQSAAYNLIPDKEKKP